MAYFTSVDSRMEFKFRAVDFMMASNKSNSIKHIVRGIFSCQQEEMKNIREKYENFETFVITAICILKTEKSKVVWLIFLYASG